MGKENIGELLLGVLTLASLNNPKFQPVGNYTRMRELPKSAYRAESTEAIQLAYYADATFTSGNWESTLVLPAIGVANFYESCGQNLRDFFDQNFVFRVVSLTAPDQVQQEEPKFFKTVEELLNYLGLVDEPEVKKETISPLDFDKLLKSLDSRLYYAKCMSPLLAHLGKNFVDNKFTELKKSVSGFDLENIFADLFTGGVKPQQEVSHDTNKDKFYRCYVIANSEGITLAQVPMFTDNFPNLDQHYERSGQLLFSVAYRAEGAESALSMVFDYLKNCFNICPRLTCFLEDVKNGSEKARQMKIPGEYVEGKL